MKRRARLLILLTVLLLILIPQVLGQFSITPTSLVYIHVEPQGLGEVGYYPSFSGPLREWPRVTTPIMSFFTMAFTQGTYLYLEARPYGCAELDKWEITPQDVNMTYVGSKEKLIVILDRDYITVKAVFKKIPEASCPYIPVWGSIRFRKSDLFTFLTVTSMICSVAAVAYKVKKARDRRREMEEERRIRIEEMRNKLLEDTKRIGMGYWYPYPWHVIIYTALRRPQLEEVDIQRLSQALLEDNQLRYLRGNLGSWRSTIEQSYLSDIHIHTMALIGMKIYLALVGLIPSTDKIVEMFLESIDPRRDFPGIWDDRSAAKMIRRMMNLIESNRELHERGLRNVYYLAKTNPPFRDRIHNPPEYYEAILAKVFEWAEEYLGIKFGGIRVRPEMGDDRRYWEEQERYEREKYRLWTVSEPVEKPVEKTMEEEKPREGRIEEERGGRGEMKLLENFELPDWLREALEKSRKKEETIKKEVERFEEEERRRRVEEEVKTLKPREAPKPETPKIEVPVKWDELPRQLQIQIQDLGLTYEEVAYIALKTMDRDEREIYREANKLIMEKYPEMGEQDATSALLILVDIISQLRRMFEEEKTYKETREGKVEGYLEAHEEAKKEVEKPLEKKVEAEKLIEEVRESKEAIGEESIRGLEEAVPEEKIETEGKKYYNGVEVEFVSPLRTNVHVPFTWLALIDSPIPLEWIPTPIMADIFHESDQKPIDVEGEKYYGKDILTEAYRDVIRMARITRETPVLVLGRPGHISQRGKRRAVYIERLKELMRRLAKEKMLDFAVAMPLQIYKQYFMDDPVLKHFEKCVYTVDLEGTVEKLKGKVPDGALPYLALISSLSPSLLRELSEGRGPSRWRPQEYKETEEGKALAWAVRKIYSKAGPLTVEEIVEAGYEGYLESFKVLGMVKE